MTYLSGDSSPAGGELESRRPTCGPGRDSETSREERGPVAAGLGMGGTTAVPERRLLAPQTVGDVAAGGRA
jgi:hypothetical protein